MPIKKSSRRPRAARLAPAERKNQLLQHAIADSAESGLAHLRPVDVAAAAGVSEATVFSYFKTRDELIQAVLDRVEDFYTEQIQQFLCGQDDTASRAILSLGAAFAASVNSHPDYARIWLDWSNRFGETTFPRYQRYEQRVLGLIVEVLKRGLDDGTVADDIVPEDSARILYSSAQMVVQLKLTGEPAAKVDRFLISATRATIGRPLQPDDIPVNFSAEFNMSFKRILKLVS